MNNPSPPPPLEDRFLEPAGWRWHNLKTKEGKRLRFGSIYPESRIPSAVVVVLPGRTEFIEKYFEIARDLSRQNLAIWIMDWQGQGLSDRVAGGKDGRHISPPFARHVDDLHEFILGYVKHACVHPDVGRIPMMMLAQSMGANIGLRYLHKYPGMFAAAALLTPMLGIQAVRKYPAFILGPVLSLVAKIVPGAYAFGQGPWIAGERQSPALQLSHDPVRAAVHDAWFTANPKLRTSGVTYSWLAHALSSCAYLKRGELLKAINVPCLFALAGKETLVDNAAIRKAADAIPVSKVVEFAESGHEILMETDAVRQQFLEIFHLFIKEHIIDRPETLKRF